MGYSASRPVLLAATLLLAGVVLVLAGPPDAYGCAGDGPCESNTETVLCPFDGTSGTGTASFNIPKDARNVTFKIVDAVTGQEYSEMTSICAGTTMTVSSNRTSGATEDTFTVNYTINNVAGGGDPAEQHQVKVIADWERQMDLGVKKEPFGLQDGEIGTDTEVTFLVTVTNHGPAPLIGEGFMFDGARKVGQATTETGCTMLRAKQLEGPKVAHVGISGPAKDISDTVIHELPVGESVVIAVTCRPNQGPGDYENIATLAKKSEFRYEPDPDPHPNTVRVPFTVKPTGDSKVSKATPTKVKGTAAVPQGGGKRGGDVVEAVEVAILRVPKGLDPLEGQLEKLPARRGAACEWVKNARGATKKTPSHDGVCDQPVWLRAKGTDRWSFVLRQELEKGSYVAYSRALVSGGVPESNFSDEDGNRRAFRVR